MFVRDLFRSQAVQDSSIEIIREDVFTNNADFQSAELATKAESDITYTNETIAVKTLAHFIRASRQILADAPRLRGEIDSRLTYGLNLKGDEQLLYGDGTGQNFTGLMVDAGVTDLGHQNTAIISNICDADILAFTATLQQMVEVTQFGARRG